MFHFYHFLSPVVFVYSMCHLKVWYFLVAVVAVSSNDAALRCFLVAVYWRLSGGCFWRGGGFL